METLPPEMVAMIACYLPVKDVASCCAVSPQWREMFGSDEVWRPRCDADSEDYLRTTPCRVEPKFTSPEAENSTLSPIGRWRTAYMREKHLWKNWIHGNCVQDEINSSIQNIVFLSNDFVITFGEGFIRLLDTTLDPPVCVAKFVSTIITCNCNLSFVRSDTFIIWDHINTVQVIGVDWESYALSVKHTFCIREDKICEFGIVNYVIVNTLLVGYSENLLLVWDVEKGTKLKTDSVSDGLELTSIVHDEKCETLGVLASSKHNMDYLFMYNVKELRFWPFTKSFPTSMHEVAIVEHYVALVIGSRIEVFNYLTSQCIYTADVYPGKVRTMGNSFIFGHRLSHVCPPIDLVQFFPSTGVITCLLSNIAGFVCCRENLFTVWPNENEVQMWKMTPKSTVKTVILNPSLLPVYLPLVSQSNRICSKVIIWNRKYDPILFTYW